MVIVNLSSFDCHSCRLRFDEGDDVTGQKIKTYISGKWGIPANELKLCQGKRYLCDDDIVQEDETLHVLLSLVGGKGGFGSMLRAIGAQIEKTTNKEACRDLSGRRLRDINEEKRLKKWIAKQAEREREQAERRRQRLERLRTPPTHEFHDPAYDKVRAGLTDKVHDAVSQGIQKMKKDVTHKRKAEATITRPVKKKNYRWMEDEDSSESDGDSGDASPPGQSSDNPFMEQSSSDSISMQNEAKSSVASSTSDESQPAETSHSAVKEHGDEMSHQSEDSSTEISVNAEQLSTTEEEDSCSNIKSNMSDQQTTEVTETSQTVEAIVENDSSENNLITSDEKKYKIEDVEEFESVEQLETVGLNELKEFLACLGMKCGGSLNERAQRLWNVKGLKAEDIPAQLLAKKK